MLLLLPLPPIDLSQAGCDLSSWLDQGGSGAFEDVPTERGIRGLGEILFHVRASAHAVRNELSF